MSVTEIVWISAFATPAFLSASMSFEAASAPRSRASAAVEAETAAPKWAMARSGVALTSPTPDTVMPDAIAASSEPGTLTVVSPSQPANDAAARPTKATTATLSTAEPPFDLEPCQEKQRRGCQHAEAGCESVEPIIVAAGHGRILRISARLLGRVIAFRSLPVSTGGRIGRPQCGCRR